MPQIKCLAHLRHLAKQRGDSPDFLYQLGADPKASLLTTFSTRRQILVLPPDEIQASFLDESLEPGKYFLSGDTLNQTIVNFTTAPLNFTEPFSFNLRIGGTVQLLP